MFHFIWIQYIHLSWYVSEHNNLCKTKVVQGKSGGSPSNVFNYDLVIWASQLQIEVWYLQLSFNYNTWTFHLITEVGITIIWNIKWKFRLKSVVHWFWNWVADLTPQFVVGWLWKQLYMEKIMIWSLSLNFFFGCGFSTFFKETISVFSCNLCQDRLVSVLKKLIITT